MIDAGDLRTGQTIDRGGELFEVVDFAHVKLGRGSAFVRAKFRKLSNGAVAEETFRPEEKFVHAFIDHVSAMLLYRDGDMFQVMDSTSYDQFALPASLFGEGGKFATDNLEIELLQYEGKTIGVELPITVSLLVTQTDPGFKGDTANPGTKPAKLETGATIDVPLFVNEGDKVKIDTRTGRYVERV